jgi:signal transduction histidine kinase/DNA-binding response OmpR family regulator/ligand-binding sensor domain-containing protein
VGTEDGLFRFDGTNFSSFRRNNENSGLPNNTVNTVFVDSSNKIWALTNYGIGIYDYQTDSIKSYSPEQIGVQNDIKTFNAAVQASDGSIYIGTPGDGVWKFKDEVFSRLEMNAGTNTILSNLEISDIEIDHNTLWVGTWRDGVYKIDLTTGSAEQILLQSSEAEMNYIYDLTLDTSNMLWVGTDKGYQLINDQQVVRIPALNISDEILSIWVTDNNDVWFGTRMQGLFLLNDGDFTNELVHFEPRNDEVSISHHTISEVFQDQAHNLWLGTHNKGINVFNPAGESVAVIQPEPQETSSSRLNISSVWGISACSDGGLWMGTDGGGLHHFDPSLGSTKLFASKNKGLKLSDNALLSTYEISDGRLLLGTYSGGLNILDKKTEKVSLINTTSGLESSDVRSIYEDTRGDIWIGTNRGGLYKINLAKKTAYLIKSSDGMDIRGIVQIPGEDNILWMATYGNGLAKFNIKTEELTFFNWNSDEGNFIPISMSIAYARDKIWVGSKQSGLVSFDPTAEKFKIISEADGLLNNTVRAIVVSKDHLWLSSNMGISAYNMKTGNLKNFDAFDGVTSGQFNDGSGLLYQNQFIAFGGINGMILFDPAQLLKDKPLPKVTFTKLELDNKIVRPHATSDYLSTSISIADEIRFGPDENIFTIHFSVLDFPNPHGWNYEFKLDGFDKNWNQSINIAEATYRNIPPGDYVFQTRVVDTNGTEGIANSLAVSIAPPWWRTMYAYVAFTLMLIMILYMIYKFNFDRVEMKQSLLFEQKLRHQEHDIMQDKIRFYTNFSHEMRTPITLITGPVNDMLRNENISTGHKHTLNLIKRNANTLLKLINRLLEFRKLETENTVLNVGNHDLTILAQEEAESFTYLAKDKDVKFGFYCETDLQAWMDIEKFQIIINNLLSNALKYAERDTKVTFKVYQESPHLIIEVQDEGRGIDAAEINQIFTPFYQAKNSIGTGGTGIGLALCKSFVELHGGKITVQSDIGKGATFKVIFKEGKEHLESLDNVRFTEVQQGDIADNHEPNYSKGDLTTHDILENDKVLLIAEDHADIRYYVSSLFESSFRVLQATDGVQALELAKETVPDVIISDIMMPEMDGLEFCKAIKGNVATSHVPVILLTAKGTSQTKIDGYDVGADGYLTKPFDSQVLIARVNNLLQSREHLQELHESGKWIENKNVPSSEIEFVLKVESVVLEMTPKGELSVIQLCRELGFSRTSLYRKIKSITGQSINQFIRSIKLKKAAEMLATEDKAVSEVAFSLNFTDLKYFRSCFKKQYGKLPSEYQNEMKSKESVNPEEIRKALKI